MVEKLVRFKEIFSQLNRSLKLICWAKESGYVQNGTKSRGWSIL